MPLTLQVFDPDIGALINEHAGSKLVVTLAGEEQCRGTILVDGIDVSAVRQEDLQHVCTTTHCGSVVQPTGRKSVGLECLIHVWEVFRLHLLKCIAFKKSH